MDDRTSSRYIFLFMLLLIPFLVIGLNIKQKKILSHMITYSCCKSWGKFYLYEAPYSHNHRRTCLGRYASKRILRLSAYRLQIFIVKD